MKTLLENDDKKSFNLYQTYDVFQSKRIDNLFVEYKPKGLAFATVFYQLIEMTIPNFTIHQHSTRNDDLSKGKKDVYYRLKNDPRVDWRLIVYKIVNRFLLLSIQNRKNRPTNRGV